MDRAIEAQNVSKVGIVFKALSDPTRRAILDRLRKRDMTAGEIAEGFDMTKPSISHHLNLLKQAELVVDMRRGQSIIYSLNTTVVQETLQWMVNFLEQKKQKA